MFSFFSNKTVPQKSIPLKFFNTESKKIEIFIPLNSKQITMYSCGPTVYDFAHIGNLRAFVFVDLLKRTLLINDYKVKNTINFTDFGHLTDDADAGEDKIMKGLRREGKPITLEAMRELSDFYIDAFINDINELRILPPTHFSRASDFITEQIQLIKTLEEKGYTYETSDGVYFDVEKFPQYGRLGNVDIHQLINGARVEANTEKHHATDFAVWKKGELGWDSHWGKGFPGWHIECSAMAMATLGKQIDIHTGGIEHIPVHHNAEISQCECATGKTFVKYWLHNEHLKIDNTKISKSLGNTLTLRHLRDAGFSGDDYRYWLLTSNYRASVNFSFEALKGAKQALFRIKRFIYEECQNQATKSDPDYIKSFFMAINNDLNTPKVITLLFDIIKDKNLASGVKCATIKYFDKVLGIGLDDKLDDALFSLGVLSIEDTPAEIQELVNEREVARIIHNWDESDRLRTELNIRGYAVEDGPNGTKISKSSQI